MLKLKDPYTVQLSYDAHKSICNLPCTDPPPPSPQQKSGREGGTVHKLSRRLWGAKKYELP